MHRRTRPSLNAPPQHRVAQESDAEALAAFRCSAGRWFQDEVEQFVNGRREQRLLIPERRVLLFTVDDEVVAVAAHQRGRLLTAAREITAAHLVVLAVAEHLHGASLRVGGRLSDHLMQRLLADALETYETEVAFAIVAIENQRSLTLCERNGLTSQTVVTDLYARLTGRFALQPQP